MGNEDWRAVYFLLSLLAMVQFCVSSIVEGKHNGP